MNDFQREKASNERDEILIVEDSPTQAEQLKYLLETQSWKREANSKGGISWEFLCGY